MIPTNQYNSIPANYDNSSLRDLTLPTRNRIELQLENIGDLLPTEAADQTTEDIRNWYQALTRDLETRVSKEWLLEKYKPLLAEILEGLDEDPYLGSDGHTYNSSLLYIHFIEVEPNLRNRSPRDPRNSAAFTAKPHTLAKYMVEWLLSHGGDLPQSPEMNQRYEYLQRFIEADKTLVIPTADPRLIRLQVSAANGIEQKRNLLRSLEAEFRNQFQGTYREIEQLEHQVSAFRSTTDARLDHIDQTARQQIAAIGRQQERLQTEIDSLHSRNRELDGRIAKVKTGVDSIEQEQAKIEVAINETRAAIKERKKEGLGQLVTVIACVGVGVFTAHQLGIAIIPSANGAGVSLFAPL
ncbi:MAG: hypothetical protein K0S74_1149 [Chlamydiales bacterium]|jgi:hypothetical protein|nr:hypothetical protein [Chlamydiales bacterium]